MEYLPNGLTLSLCDGAFPLSTDSILLSHFVRLPKNASVLDLGSGCGTLGLLLCSKDRSCRVTGVELEDTAHQEALRNIRHNRLDTRMESICADLRSVSERFSPGSFSCCVSNPPYFSEGAISVVQCNFFPLKARLRPFAQLKQDKIDGCTFPVPHQT